MLDYYCNCLHYSYITFWNMSTNEENSIAIQINLHDDGGATVNKRDDKKINHDKEPVQLA